MTKSLSGLVLDPADEVINNSNAKDPREKLNTKVVSRAISQVKEALDGYSYNGFKWTVSGMNPEEDNPQANIDGTFFKRKFDDQKKLYEFHKLSSVNKINQPVNKKMLEEFKFFNQHVDQRDHSMVFARYY